MEHILRTMEIHIFCSDSWFSSCTCLVGEGSKSGGVLGIPSPLSSGIVG